VAQALTRAAPYGRRFGLVYFALAIVVGAAAGSAIVLLARGGHERSPWASWRPTAAGDFKTKEIVDHVAAAYRLENGDPLVDISTGDPFPSVVTEVATPAIAAGVGSKTPIYDASTTRMFVLCGSGKNCSVPGPATAARAELLRREAVELALYTFKYVPTDSVVEFLPGRQKSRPDFAFFFRRKELEPFLSQPLRATLTAGPRRTDGLALSHLFHFELQPSQTGGGLLVLDRG
jgi:hypothetical protein